MPHHQREVGGREKEEKSEIEKGRIREKGEGQIQQVGCRSFYSMLQIPRFPPAGKDHIRTE